MRTRWLVSGVLIVSLLVVGALAPGMLSQSPGPSSLGQSSSALAQVPSFDCLDPVVSTNTFCDYFSLASTLDGVPVLVGAVIDAFDPQGVHCGTYVVQKAGWWGVMHVYGDDTTTEDIDEGASPGDQLTFQISCCGSTVTVVTPGGDATWQPQKRVQINLAGVSSCPTATPEATQTSTPTPIATAIETVTPTATATLVATLTETPTLVATLTETPTPTAGPSPTAVDYRYLYLPVMQRSFR